MSASSVWSETKTEKLFEALRTGRNRRQACRAANIGKTSFYERLGSDEDFRLEVEEAEEESVDEIEHALWDRAKSGNMQAVTFYLTNRRPEKWQDRRTVKSNATVELKEGRAQVEAYERLCDENQRAFEEFIREEMARDYKAEFADTQPAA